MRQFPCSPNLRFSLVILFRDIAVSLNGELFFNFNHFRSIFFVIIWYETFYNSLVNKELLRDIVEANLCKIFISTYNDLIDKQFKDKLKNLVFQTTKPGAGEVEEGYPEEELAEDREVNEKVLGDEECDAREEDLGSEGEFGLIEAACELPGSPTSEVQYSFILCKGGIAYLRKTIGLFIY